MPRRAWSPLARPPRREGRGTQEIEFWNRKMVPISGPENGFSFGTALVCLIRKPIMRHIRGTKIGTVFRTQNWVHFPTHEIQSDAPVWKQQPHAWKLSRYYRASGSVILLCAPQASSTPMRFACVCTSSCAVERGRETEAAGNTTPSPCKHTLIANTLVPQPPLKKRDRLAALVRGR
jgi:hypothetical protein